MTARTVNAGMVTYTDRAGVRRIGTAGEQVDVHPDDLKRFAEVNGSIEVQAPTKKAAPTKKQGRQPARK